MLRTLHLFAAVTIPIIIVGCDSTQAAQTDYGPRTRLMSYNIRHCQGSDRKVNVQRVADVIMREKPDFVGLNEVDCQSGRVHGLNEAMELGRLTGLHATFAKAIPLQGGEYGNAVLSREKPISVERISLPGKEPRVLLLCEFTDFWFGTMHLDFGKHHLKSVSVVRDVVARKAKGKPVFLTGDWNATPKSKTLAAMREFMTIISKEEDSLTFHGFKNHPPGHQYCIDYIAVDSGHATGVKVCESHVTDNITASDHNPVLVSVVLSVVERSAGIASTVSVERPGGDFGVSRHERCKTRLFRRVRNDGDE